MPIAPAIQDLEKRIGALPPESRLAFVAASAERVVPVHEYDGYADSDDLQRAAELVWQAALGEKVSAAAIKKASKGVAGAMPENAEDEPTYSATVLSAVAVLNALDAIQDQTPTSAIRVSRGEYDAYEALGNDTAREHEQDWQTRAVALLESRGKPLTRDMFDPLGDPPTHLFPEQLP